MTTDTCDVSDPNLADLATQGDQSAFNSLLSRHLPAIQFYCNKYFAPGLTKEDLHQAGCIGLFIACKKYNPHKGMVFASFAKLHVKHYMINAVVTALRKKHRILNHSVSIDDTSAAQTGRYERMQQSAPSAEQICIAREKYTELLELIRKHLTELEQVAVRGLVDGLPYTEIADLAGVDNKKTIDNALSRAKGKLRTFLYSNA